MEIILEGIITGLLLTIFVGATFFMLIETSMTRGFKAALWFDLGVLSCDAIVITAVYFFASWINRLMVHAVYFKIAGGIAFISFGINYIVSRRQGARSYKATTQAIRLVLNGFIINLLNPAVVVFWLGSVAVAITQFKMTGREAFLYFATTLIVVACTDIAKSYFAIKLCRFMSPRILRTIYIASGVLMIGFGVLILLR